MARVLVLPVCLAIFGCHAGGGGDGSTESSSTSTGGDEGSDIDPSLSHGFVRLHFTRAEGAAGDFFATTDTVIATLSYGDCLSAFYAGNPNLQQYGMAGGPIFGRLAQGGEGWQDRLCAANTAEHVDCSIVWITQQFDDATKDLTVTYRVHAPLEEGVLLFGPIPTAATAGCAAPTVEVSGTATVIGQDADEVGLWQLDTSAPNEAMTNQDDPIVIGAAPAAG
ncbi:MAG TPA: hypothetical protein VG755_45910 [Nannocystaceae bacterium]|nr:hypothetical protein [Nannocystaceae bacterium]